MTAHKISFIYSTFQQLHPKSLTLVMTNLNNLYADKNKFEFQLVDPEKLDGERRYSFNRLQMRNIPFYIPQIGATDRPKAKQTMWFAGGQFCTAYLKGIGVKEAPMTVMNWERDAPPKSAVQMLINSGIARDATMKEMTTVLRNTKIYHNRISEADVAKIASPQSSHQPHWSARLQKKSLHAVKPDRGRGNN